MVNDPRCQKLSDDLLKEMGKQPLTKPMIDQFSKEAKKQKRKRPTNKTSDDVYHDIALSAFAT